MSELIGGRGNDEQIVDFERRKKDADYTLGDPTAYPVEFLNWLKRYIEQSGITLPISSIIGGFKPGSASVRNMAPGLYLGFAGSTPPEGSLVCNGQSVSRTEYGLLYAVIGVDYGSIDGSTFKVPDLRDRALFGAGSLVGRIANDGAALGVRGPAHHHGSHTHTQRREVVSLTGGGTAYAIIGNASQDDSATGATLVGQSGRVQDAPGWHGGLYLITTGQ